ncbi:MAG: hypothetical protein K0S07_927 [Chlamydiales bacterium]|jgi:hypothetical protein|nr:hypothetical protein [Chlamydiales bacterium]
MAHQPIRATTTKKGVFQFKASDFSISAGKVSISTSFTPRSPWRRVSQQVISSNVASVIFDLAYLEVTPVATLHISNVLVNSGSGSLNISWSNDGGSTYLTGYQWCNNGSGSGSGVSTVPTLALSTSNPTVGEVVIWNATNTTSTKKVQFCLSRRGSSGAIGVSGAGIHTNTGAITHIKLSASANSLSLGTFTLYCYHSS